MQDLAGKVAVITGGGSGIGRGMAVAFAEAGMRVAVADVDAAAASGVRDELSGRGAEALAVETDVSDLASVQSLADRVYSEWGAAHVLCNNAGVTTVGGMENLSNDDWRWVLSVNLDGVIFGIQSFLPRMREQEGEKHIVNTASIAGMLPMAGFGPYSASKYAVVGITEVLRQEGAAYGLSCSVLCPGNVRTAIVASARNRPAEFGGPSDEVNPFVQKLIDEGLDPEEVGCMVRQAVLDDDLFIFTHPQQRSEVVARFESILKGFDVADGRSKS